LTGVLAVSGKGGTGKTTISGLVIQYLVEKGLGPVLAVDADANSNLNMVLGVELTSTVGAVREDLGRKIQKGEVPAGMPKQDLLEMQIEQAMVETKEFDFLGMGRAEGPGCYCAVNNMLRTFLDRISENYNFVVIDNEAGMEHLSRRTSRGIDVMFVTSDPSIRGLETAVRIKNLARELELDIRKFMLVITRAVLPLDPNLAAAAEETGLDIAGIIPIDESVVRVDAAGEPLSELAPDSVARLAVNGIMDGVLSEVSM
jgi:CO dehydrogenase maturation factor